MIAFHDNRAAGRIIGHRGDDVLRIGTISDEIAEERITLRTVVGRVPETRLQRFEIAVDVGEKGDDHTSPIRCRS